LWDGADLSLIRDTLNRLVVKERRRSIAIQMRTVKYVPSGFFGMLFDWCVNHAPGSCYLRLVSLPWDIPYSLPAGYQPQLGRGVVLVEGGDAAIVSYGPVLLSAATQAANVLRKKEGLKIKVINMPWLNDIDVDWLDDALGGCNEVFSLDNHYRVGGQGDRIAAAILDGAGPGVRFHRIAVGTIPACGTNPEVLAAHGLDVNKLASKIAGNVNL
jgi:transketolase